MSVIALQLDVSKIFAIFHFPIGHNVKLQFYKINIIGSNFCVDCQWEEFKKNQGAMFQNLKFLNKFAKPQTSKIQQVF